MTVGLALATFTVFAGGASADHGDGLNPPSGSDGNQASNWETWLDGQGHPDATCTKTDNVNAPTYTLGEPPEGEVWLLLVLKAGSDQNTDSNQLFWNPSPGTYDRSASDGKDISHAIQCSEPETEETTTTEESTVPEESSTTEATVAPAGSTVPDESTTTVAPPPPPQTAAPTQTGTLPKTGAGTDALVAIGLGLFLSGLGIVLLDRMRLRRVV